MAHENSPSECFCCHRAGSVLQNRQHQRLDSDVLRKRYLSAEGADLNSPPIEMMLEKLVRAVHRHNFELQFLNETGIDLMGLVWVVGVGD